MRQLFQELKRRNVYRVAATYAVVAFVTLQAAELVFPATTLEGVYDVLVVIAFVGFPIALVIAWAFELTPEGVRRTPEAAKQAARQGEPGEADADAPSGTESPSPEERRSQSHFAMKALVGLGLVAAAVVGGWYLVGGGGESPEVADRSVAVLPFEARGREEPGTFTAGMHAALSSRLANVSDLRVSPSRAVQAYEDTSVSMARIAGELGVGWVVTGNVQSTEDEVRVIVELVDPATGTQRWSDDYTRDLTAASLFDLQGEISREIAQSLEAELSAEERERIARRPTGDLDAYRLYVRGRGLLGRRTASSIDSARVFFEQALEHDSTYALAWVGLADARSQYAAYTGNDASLESAQRLGAALPEARDFVRRALVIDPDLAEAHASLGLIHYYEQLTNPEARNGPAGVRNLQRALELKPSYAEAHHWLAVWQRDLGRSDVALEHLRLAVELSPENFAARRGLAGVLLANGRYREALTQARRLQETLPDRESGPALEVAALVHLKRWPDVRDAVLPHLSRAEEPPVWAIAFQALAEVREGETDGARAWLEDLHRGSDARAAFARALIQAALGKEDEALSTLVEGFSENDAYPYQYNSALMSRSGLLDLRYLYSDVLRPVRQSPRFRELIEEVNVAWGLNPDGSLPEGGDAAFDPPQSDA